MKAVAKGISRLDFGTKSGASTPGFQTPSKRKIDVVTAWKKSQQSEKQMSSFVVIGMVCAFDFIEKGCEFATLILYFIFRARRSWQVNAHGPTSRFSLGGVEHGPPIRSQDCYSTE